MQISKKATHLGLLLALASSQTLLAQDANNLNAEQLKRVDELNLQIQQLNDELSNIQELQNDASASAAQPQEAVAIVEEAASEEKIKLWSGNVEFGYVDSSGNTEETTVKTGFNATREKEQWRYSIEGNSFNTKKDNDRSSEKYFLSNRLAYQYNEHDYSFVHASYDDDRFSGFDYQATASLGYGRRILNNETMKWDAEIGPGYRVSKVDSGTNSEDSEEVILRLFTGFNWDFSKNANFSQTVNIEAGEDNTISKSVSALKMSIIGELSMKLSYTVKYTETVPNDNSHADTETAVTLSYDF